MVYFCTPISPAWFFVIVGQVGRNGLIAWMVRPNIWKDAGGGRLSFVPEQGVDTMTHPGIIGIIDHL
jgi:hypothetical protein